MIEPDYKIEELFDFDEMLPYYKVFKRTLTGEYMPLKTCDTLDQAKYCVRMGRKYKNRIFHYVEN